jgi:hypothetical protein
MACALQIALIIVESIGKVKCVQLNHEEIEGHEGWRIRDHNIS